MKWFEVEIRGRAILSEAELWPEGDGPANPTPEDVMDIIESDFEDAFEAAVELGVPAELEISELLANRHRMQA